MSEVLEYVNERLAEAADKRLGILLSGDVTTIEKLENHRGYLKALQDVGAWQRDFIEQSKNRNKEQE